MWPSELAGREPMLPLKRFFQKLMYDLALQYFRLARHVILLGIFH